MHELSSILDRICNASDFENLLMLEAPDSLGPAIDNAFCLTNLPDQIFLDDKDFVKNLRVRLASHFSTASEPLRLKFDTPNRTGKLSAIFLPLNVSVHSSGYLGLFYQEMEPAFSNILEICHLSNFAFDKACKINIILYEPQEKLSKLEIEILQKISEGHRHDSLHLGNLSNHSWNLIESEIVKKIGAKDISHATAIALRDGVIQ